MIDIQSDIVNAVDSAVRDEYPEAFVASALELNPATFPYICVYETDNYTDTDTRDSAGGEKHAVVAYEVSVWVNKKSGKQAQARAIFSVVDDVFFGFGFIRRNKSEIYIDDGTKYRLIGRYEAVVSKNHIIYQR